MGRLYEVLSEVETQDWTRRIRQIRGPLEIGEISMLLFRETEIYYEVTHPAAIRVGAVKRGYAHIEIADAEDSRIVRNHEIESLLGQELAASYSPFIPAIMLTRQGGMIETARFFVALLPENTYDVGSEIP